jgi:hypothetical protein
MGYIFHVEFSSLAGWVACVKRRSVHKYLLNFQSWESYSGGLLNTTIYSPRLSAGAISGIFRIAALAR